MKKYAACFATVIVLILFTIAYSQGAEKQNKSSLRIASAQRANEVSFGSERFFTPKENDHVMLVVKIAGLSSEEYDAAKENIHVAAGDKKYDMTLSFPEYESEKRDGPFKLTAILVVFSIPKDLLSCQLIIGDLPPLRLKAEKQIRGSIKV